MSNQDTESQKALRELRLWHWRQLLDARESEKQRQAEGNLKAAKYWVKQAEHHLGAVQALNAVVTGTAEEDAKQ